MRRASLCEALEQRCYLSTVNINGTDTGRIFDGLGALSNSSSRLLYDYPEPQRSQILDYMFKPDYGMSLQILKIEIGSDTNSTDLAEPSFERQRGVFNFTSGWEWWLIGQAKLRNPNIKLYGLEWGAPGWFSGGFYSQDNINYLTAFLDGASSLGFNFDYLGGWNESVANPSNATIQQWFVNLRAAMNVNHPNTKLVAYDDGGTDWRIADDVANPIVPAFPSSIDILGQHSPGVWRSQYQDYTEITPNALNSGKPLWASEQSAESYDVGGQSWARGIVREYVQADITAALAWNAVDAFYPSGNHADTGIMMAEDPWSGYYALGSIVWVFAQTTQFTQPGWQYLDGASGEFDTGAYYVSLKSNTTNDYSTVVESMDATSAETETFNVSGGLSTGTVHVWATNVASSTLSDDFIHVADLTPVNGSFSYTIQPGYVYTFSTTTGQSKGTAAPTATAADQMPLPYSENFDEYGASGKLAKYWQDLQGGFETAPAEGGRSGYAYRQVITTPPIPWSGGATEPPTSMMGDMRWWGDYQFTSDVLLENSGYVEIIGRIGAASSPHVSGYHFQVSDSGTWKLYSEEAGGADTTLASGSGVSFALNTWHTMSLKMTGNQIVAILDGKTLTTVTNTGFITGNVAIRVSNLNGAYQNAEFDNITITRTTLPPAFVPHSQMTAYASDTYSFDGGFYQGMTFATSFGIDDMPETMWQSSFNPRTNPPHWYMVDMGTAETISGIVYQPRIDNNTNGMFTQYTIYVSNDGTNFTAAASGTWPTTSASKMVTFASQQARYVKLYEGNSNLASLAELNIIQTRSNTISTAPDLSASSDLGVSTTDNITSLNNSSSAKKLQFTVNGTTAGSVVRTYSDGTLIGTTTATGPLATITTDGATALADGTHVITATQQAATLAESAASIGLTITIDTTAPTASVSAMPPLGGKAVAIGFSEPIVLPQGAGAIQLTNLTTGQSIPSGNISETYNSATQTATFSFPGFPNSVLPDGNYQGQLPTTAATDTAGNSLAANVPLSFFILTADANHDRTVNALDFNALATNYGKAGTFSQGDFNYSGTVDSSDFALLASKYGTVLAATTGMALPAAESTRIAATSLTPQRSNLFADQPIDDVQLLLDPTIRGLDEFI